MHYQAVKAGYNGTSYTVNDPTNLENNPRSEYDLERVTSYQASDLGEGCIHYGGNGGSNSGFQAVNLAYMLGAKTILLLGFDMCGTHYFGEHPEGLNRNSPFKNFIQVFDGITKDIEIINCTRMTALTRFPKLRIDTVLT